MAHALNRGHKQTDVIIIDLANAFDKGWCKESNLKTV